MTWTEIVIVVLTIVGFCIYLFVTIKAFVEHLKDNGDVVELEIKEDLSIDLFYEMSDTGLDYNNYNASGNTIEELINHK